MRISEIAVMAGLVLLMVAICTAILVVDHERSKEYRAACIELGGVPMPGTWGLECLGAVSVAP